MTAEEVDLGELAKELEGKADELATEAATVRAHANAAATETAVVDPYALDPLFAEKLELSLAPARQRLQDIAKRSA